MLKEIIEDYRNDWITRCADEALSLYGSDLGEKRIYLYASARDELSSAMIEILRSLRKKRALKNNGARETIVLVWSMGNAVFDEKRFESRYGKNCRIIFVSDKPDMSSCMPPYSRGLYCGTVFGAGLSESIGEQRTDNDATSVMCFFMAQLFMAASYDKLGDGIYYAGSGECAVKNAYSLYERGFEPILSEEDEEYMLKFFRTHPDERFYFDNTYDGKLLLLHSLLMKCLLEFDRICKKHDIKYYLGGGTLLGAVRHGSVIPWDDDVDVMMLRPDYDRFLRVAEKELSPDMFFQTNETDKYFHSNFAKIRLNGTKFVSRFSSQFPDMHHGIFIDIFVHDKTSKYRPMQKLHVFLTLFARSMVFHKWGNTDMHFYGRLKLVCKAATWYIRRTPMKTLENFQDKILRLYEKKNTGYLYDGTGEHLRHGAFPEKWLDKPVYADMSGYKSPIPSDTDNYLRYSYGDYGHWPCASLRKAGHDVVEVDFGPYDRDN